MNRIGALLGLIAETPVHCGTGQSIGGIDLPVQREGHTGLPTIPGSSLKGALRENCAAEDAKVLYGSELGTDEHFAGALTLTDCRLMALPVRCSSRLFVWVTSAYMIHRLERDLSMIGIKLGASIEDLDSNTVFATIESTLTGKTLLEDVLLDVKKDGRVSRLASVMSQLVCKTEVHGNLMAKLLKDLVVVSDSTMSHLSRFATIITARNQLEDRTKRSNNLWYAEAVPTDSLFYSIVMAGASRDESKKEPKDVMGLFSQAISKGYVQLGGNETIGAGWMSAKLLQEQDLSIIAKSGV
ncbi:MAG: type III-B CRISPR module RAMP protein Cmr4 [Candidatus Thorarchaeota archaeon]|nr:type III-B CRISPR module RAMP protein Cmr4 [Candidatus Thorarchaeota archaeon]